MENFEQFKHEEKQQQIKVSIIIPVYNVEKYLSVCLESLIHQTLQEIEIILVNDGSSDKSGEIAEQYAQKDQRIKVLHQTNAGASSARNAGMALAHGEYIGFVDSDDWIDVNMYERLYTQAKKADADISICGYNLVTNGVVRVVCEHPLAGKTFNTPEAVASVRKKLYGIGKNDESSRDPFPGNVCMGIFRRCLIESANLKFEDGLSEDNLFSIDVYKISRTLVFTKDNDYYYRRDYQPSVSITLSNSFGLEYIKYFSRLYEKALAENDPECIQRVKRNSIDYTRVFIDIISHSNLPFRKKRVILATYAQNEKLQDFWKDYPLEYLLPKARILQILLQKHCYTGVLLLDYLHVKKKAIII